MEEINNVPLVQYIVWTKINRRHCGSVLKYEEKDESRMVWVSGVKTHRSLISAWPHQVVISYRKQKRGLICWQRWSRGVLVLGTRCDGGTRSCLGLQLFFQPSVPQEGPKPEDNSFLSTKRCTFLASNACCIPTWRWLHLISENTISLFYPVCKALWDPSRRKMLQKYQAVTYLLFRQWAFLDRSQEVSFLCCFCYCPFLGLF